MWCFVTIGHGADADDVADVLAKMQGFIDHDSEDETSATIVIYNPQSAQMHKDTFLLKFLPIGMVHTLGPDPRAGVTRKAQYYLTRNKKGEVVKKLSAIKR